SNRPGTSSRPPGEAIPSQGTASPPDDLPPEAGFDGYPPAIDLSDTDEAQEREIVRLMLNYGSEELNEGLTINQFLLSNLEDVHFTDPIVRKILDEIKAGTESGQTFGPQDFTR